MPMFRKKDLSVLALVNDINIYIFKLKLKLRKKERDLEGSHLKSIVILYFHRKYVSFTDTTCFV